MLATIGPDKQAGDYFSFSVATPAGLELEAFSGWSKGLLIVPEFSWLTVEQALERLLADCARPSWEEVARAIGLTLKWQFENYKPFRG